MYGMTFDGKDCTVRLRDASGDMMWLGCEYRDGNFLVKPYNFGYGHGRVADGIVEVQFDKNWYTLDEIAELEEDYWYYSQIVGDTDEMD